ncbi:MAG: tol-pal system-associated acyl-CoA thioesterase [Gammaproteobacteria bacterium]|nr:MAG: tol-pal system-associated acyl-CoA thioesterase [Gammaproteobacteria bacterium]
MATDSPFIWTVRVYYEDTDCGGVVYHTAYLRFMERARTEWLRKYGFEQDSLLRDNILFAVHSLEVQYHRPARFNDLLEVSVEIDCKTPASLTFAQKIQHSEFDSLLCSARVKVVCLSADRFRPCKMPASINKEIFGEY